MGYPLALFVHLIGVALVAIAMAHERAAMVELDRAESLVDVHSGRRSIARATATYPVSWLAVLGSGVYLAVTRTGWPAWLVISLLSTLTLPTLGAMVSGPRLQQRSALLAERFSAGKSNESQSADHILVTLFRLRLAIAVSVLWIMTAKPWISGAIWTLVSLTLLALASVVLTRRLPGPSGPAARS